MSHQTLIARAKRRDAEAVAELYRQYMHPIARYVGYRISDAQVVEDITASVFLIMVEKLPHYEDRAIPFEAWLYRIASTQIADYYRQQGRRMTTPLDEGQASGEESIEKQVAERERQAALQMALNQLTEEEQAILFLRFVERRRHEEVATTMGKSPQAVATTQHRLLKRLAALLGREA